jgi:hypothetical protein
MKEIGKFNRVMHKGNRFYQAEGSTQLYPSVTTVLGVIHKPQIMQWGDRVSSGIFLLYFFEFVDCSLAYFRAEMELHSQKVLLSPNRKISMLNMILDAQQEPIRQR